MTFTYTKPDALFFTHTVSLNIFVWEKYHSHLILLKAPEAIANL